jgi:hypothetical protein
MPGSSPGKVKKGAHVPYFTLAGLDPAIVTHSGFGD